MRAHIRARVGAQGFEELSCGDGICPARLGKRGAVFVRQAVLVGFARRHAPERLDVGGHAATRRAEVGLRETPARVAQSLACRL